jgi:3-methyladenine DNA glycosylase/8-oxoguanine DNA glycosylase
MVEIDHEVRPKWPLRLPRWGGPDGLARVRDRALRRLLHAGDEAVIVTVRQPARDRLAFAARAPSRAAAEHGIERMRFALGVDDDLRPFYERFRWDPLIGPAVRRDPLRRTFRKPQPFEALVAAITEQLIEFGRAVAIQKRIVRRLGRRCPDTGLRDLPAAPALAGTAPALLQSLDLSAGRARGLVRAAREVAAGRVDLHASDHERAWARLRAIPGIGPWTVEMVALTGQGRLDVVPAGDLAFLKLVGRLRTGNPHVRAEEAEVREFFARFDPWAGQAAAYLHSPHALARRASAAA